MLKEIERKFLIKKLPQTLNKHKFYKLSQGYIFLTDNDEIRLRQKDKNYYQTIKSGTDRDRIEYEIELNEDQFNTLWPLTEGKRVNKKRWEITYGKFLIELDIYSDSLEGLITAEVEFDSIEESENFIPPDWFDIEVTYNKLYKNKNLSIFGMPPY